MTDFVLYDHDSELGAETVLGFDLFQANGTLHPSSVPVLVQDTGVGAF